MIWAPHGPRGCSAGDGAPAAPPPHGRGRAQRLHFGPPGPGGQRAPGRGAGPGLGGAGPFGGAGGGRAGPGQPPPPVTARPGPGAEPAAGGESAVRAMALGSAWKQMSWLYYQYLLVTALYMLEPWERTVFSILLPAAAAPGLPGGCGERGAGSREPGSGSGQRAAGGGWRCRSRAVPVVPLRCLSVGSWVSFVCF